MGWRRVRQGDERVSRSVRQSERDWDKKYVCQEDNLDVRTIKKRKTILFCFPTCKIRQVFFPQYSLNVFILSGKGNLSFPAAVLSSLQQSFEVESIYSM